MSVLSSMKRDLSTTTHAAEEGSQAQLYAEMMQQHFQSEIEDLEGSGAAGSMEKLLYLGEQNNKGTDDLPKMSPSTTQVPSTLSRSLEAEQSMLMNTSFPCNTDQNALPLDPLSFPGQLDPAASLLAERLSAMGSPTLSAAYYLDSPQWNPPKLESVQQPPPTQRKRKTGGRRVAWKPNNDQLRILDQHLNSGKPMAESVLLKALKKCGRVTSMQLSTWLSNWRSKVKPFEKKSEKDEKSDGSESSLHMHESHPQEGSLEQAFEEFDQDLNSIMSEMSSIMGSIKGSDICTLCRALLHARHIICHGVGLEGYVMQAFACDLNQLGLKAFYMTDISLPQISEGDIFVASTGPSFYASVSAVALEAKRLGAHVIAFTAHASADMLFANTIIRVPSQTLTPSMPILSKKSLNQSETVSFLPNGSDSVLNMGDSYNLGLKIAQEGVICMLRCKLYNAIL